MATKKTSVEPVASLSNLSPGDTDDDNQSNLAMEAAFNDVIAAEGDALPEPEGGIAPIESEADKAIRVRDEKGKFVKASGVNPKAVEKVVEPPVEVDPDANKAKDPLKGKAVEPVVEDPKKGKAVEPPKAETTVPDDAVIEAEPPKGMHPSKQADWRSLQTVAKNYKTEATELKAKLTPLETEVTQLREVAKTVEQLTKERDELEERDYLNNPEKSKRITQTFDTKLTEISNQTYELLKAFDLPKDPADALRIAKELDLKDGKPEGTTKPGLSWEQIMTAAVTPNSGINYNWLIENIVKAPALEKDLRAQKKAQKLIDDYFDLREQREDKVKEAFQNKDKVKEVLAKEDEEAAKKWNKEILNTVDGLQNALGDWAKRQPIPDNATPEQKAALKAHNDFYGVLEAGVKKAFTEEVLTPQGLAGIVMQARAELPYYRTQVEQLTAREAAAVKRAEQAEAELSAIKNKTRVRASANVPVTRLRDVLEQTPESNFAEAESQT